MPFLLKTHSVSYSYSANLYYNTFSKPNEKSTQTDWIAYAPVFDDEGIAGTTAVTQKLYADYTMNSFDKSVATRSLLSNGMYVSPLPGSLSEVETIFKLFEDNGKKAAMKTHQQANEQSAKSGEISEARIVHFATHGFVNATKPELSGIFLAQDTSSAFSDYEDIYGNIAQQNDGILYQSEIYNLKLNAELTVLSACETGLGKIAEGEGVIGLSRALLYAGSRNLVVSLWQVSDESTQKLMVCFYENLLADKNFGKVNPIFYAKHLQNSKLALISEGKYAHPFYWSPFILIGR